MGIWSLPGGRCCLLLSHHQGCSTARVVLGVLQARPVGKHWTVGDVLQCVYKIVPREREFPGPVQAFFVLLLLHLFLKEIKLSFMGWCTSLPECECLGINSSQTAFLFSIFSSFHSACDFVVPLCHVCRMVVLLKRTTLQLWAFVIFFRVAGVIILCTFFTSQKPLIHYAVTLTLHCLPSLFH